MISTNGTGIDRPSRGDSIRRRVQSDGSSRSTFQFHSMRKTCLVIRGTCQKVTLFTEHWLSTRTNLKAAQVKGVVLSCTLNNTQTISTNLLHTQKYSAWKGL